MYKFSSIIDDISFEKIKNGQKTVKFFLCDEKRNGLSVKDSFSLLNQYGEKITVIVKNIEISKNLKALIKNNSLNALGESNYESAYLNIKKWFSDEDIAKYAVMAVTMEIANE